MEKDAAEKRPPAPYISWKTFTAFIENNKGKVPMRIDTSILKNLSGTARSQLLSALRFLNLIGQDGTTQDTLKQLADAFNTPSWKPELAGFVKHSYSRVIGDLDVNTATPAMLRDRFRNFGGVDGTTVENSVRFYLSALKEAEIPFSPHLEMRQRAPRGTGTRKRTSFKTSAGKAAEYAESEAPEGMFEIPFAVLNVEGSVCLPEDISLEQWGAVNEYVRFLIDLRQKAQGIQ